MFHVTPKRLNVGAGRDAKPGWLNLDCVALPGIEVVADLEQCRSNPLPLEADSIEEFLLSHVIEHIRDVLPMMQELYRVAVPDAKMVIRCPYGGTDDAWEDPTHVRPYFINSFGYFSQPFYWRADYRYRGDWQPGEITLLCNEKCGMTAKQVLELVNRERNVVREMVAELRAVKPAREPKRELQVAPTLRLGV